LFFFLPGSILDEIHRSDVQPEEELLELSKKKKKEMSLLGVYPKSNACLVPIDGQVTGHRQSGKSIWIERNGACEK
jgi:hypothetical protein